MGVLSWALDRFANATADPTIPAQDNASARSYMATIRGVMSGSRALADDQGGAIVTTGTANGYVVVTASGVTALRPGLSLLVQIDRTNTGAATLNVDGTGPKPWRDGDGVDFVPGYLPPQGFVRVTWDANRQGWISTVAIAPSVANLSDATPAFKALNVSDPAGPGSPIGDRIAEKLDATVTPEGGTFPAPVVSILGRSLDLRRFGTCQPGSDATSDQRDANTKTIGAAILASFYDRKIGLVDFPAGDVYLGQGANSGTIRYNNALCYMQGCDNLLLRGNNTRIWLPGSSDADYLGFFAFVSNTGRCGFVGDWTVRLQNAATVDGVIAAFSAGSFVDIDVVAVPTWGGASQASPGRVKYIHAWSPDGQPTGHVAARIALGLAMYPVPGGTGKRFRVDLTNTEGVPDILNSALSGVGTPVSLKHCTYVANVLHALGNETIVVPSGFKIQDGAGMGCYAQATDLQWDGVIEPPLVNGLRRGLSTNVDGIHVKGGGRAGHVRGRIQGTGDDCINVACYTNAVLSAATTQSVTVALENPAFGTPIVGERVLLIDEAGQSRLSTTVTQRTDNALIPPTQSQLTFADLLPNGVGAGWRVINVTTAENYQVDATVRGNIGAGCRSSAFAGSITVRASKTLLSACEQSSYFGVEYTPAAPLLIDVIYRNVNCSRDALRRGLGVVAITPTRADGATAVGLGAAGSFKITRLDGSGANAPLIYARGVAKLTATRPKGDGLNGVQFNSDGFTAPAFAQFVNCNEVELDGPSNFGTTPLAINLQNVTRFKMRGQSNIAPPVTGAATIDVDAAGTGFFKSMGRLIQWGKLNGGGSSDPTLTFPYPFAASPSLFVSAELGDGSTDYMVTVNYAGLTANNVVLRPRYIGTPGSTAAKIAYSPAAISWLASGDA